MDAYLTAFFAAAGILALFLFWIIYGKRKSERMIRKKIQRIYGQVPDREYAAGDIEEISHYFRRRSGTGFTIDDIT